MAGTSARASAGKRKNLAVQVNHLSAFRRIVFTENLDWKLRPIL
jgi:hypothetical protein